MKSAILSFALLLLVGGAAHAQAQFRPQTPTDASVEQQQLSELQQLQAGSEMSSDVQQDQSALAIGGHGGFGGGFHGGGAVRGPGFGRGPVVGRGPVFGRPGIGWRPHPGWAPGWAWNRAWRPAWWRVGVAFPAFYWAASVPVGYYQCTAFNAAMQPVTQFGPDINQAAYGALYACGGANYQAAGCYIPEGYCQLR